MTESASHEDAALLEAPDSGPRATRSLRSRQSELASPGQQLAALAACGVVDVSGRPADFGQSLVAGGKGRLTASRLEIFQVNLGKLCNMTCRHCHVDAGPDRTDAMMDDAAVDATIAAMLRSGAQTVDLTGGAPELHPRFREIVERAIGAGMHVMDRCNLTILLLPKFQDLPAWFAERGVEIVASLPHCRRQNTDAQRGDGTYEKSIRALRVLNEVGYGRGDPRRRLTLVSNPAGAFLASDQAATEREWKRTLERDHGVVFDRLFLLNNMPISRFLSWLLERGQLDAYLQTLVTAFNPATVEGLMCRNTVSISWDGRVYDCDFNQMLDLRVSGVDGRDLHVRDFDPAAYAGRAIRTARHCYGCTAGAGSSCGGATVGE